MNEKMRLLKKLYGDPMVSRCCKKSVYVEDSCSETSYYVCKRCRMPCEAFLDEDVWLVSQKEEKGV